MPFKNSVKDLANQLIHVVPQHGYGWQRIGIEGESEKDLALEKPLPFQMDISEFCETENQCTVILGQVKEKTHPLNGWWVALIAAIDDVSPDLAMEKVLCMTLVCTEKPVFDPTFRPTNHPKAVNTNSLPRHRGYSVASKSFDALAEEIKSYSH